MIRNLYLPVKRLTVKGGTQYIEVALGQRVNTSTYDAMDQNHAKFVEHISEPKVTFS